MANATLPSDGGMPVAVVDQLPLEVWNLIGRLATGEDPTAASLREYAQLRLVSHTVARALIVRLYYKTFRENLKVLTLKVHSAKNQALYDLNLYGQPDWVVYERCTMMQTIFESHMNAVDALDQAFVAAALRDDPTECRYRLVQLRTRWKDEEYIQGSYKDV